MSIHKWATTWTVLAVIALLVLIGLTVGSLR